MKERNRQKSFFALPIKKKFLSTVDRRAKDRLEQKLAPDIPAAAPDLRTLQKAKAFLNKKPSCFSLTNDLAFNLKVGFEGLFQRLSLPLMVFLLFFLRDQLVQSEK